MEAEPGEGKAHEMKESPEEETREGSESEEGDHGKTSRKRSAKGAKKTKVPMDGEGCGCGGKKGATCDGNCGSSMKKRSDALTPQEYLAACDLGIQGRSRSYIRARLDAAERMDLKCGRGSISKGEKCSKGAATEVRAYNQRVKNTNPLLKGGILDPEIAGATRGQTVRRTAVRGAKIGATTGAIYGAGVGGMFGGIPGAALGGTAGAALGAAQGAAMGATVGAFKKKRPKGTGNEAQGFRYAMSYGLVGPKRVKQVDSMYASGFTFNKRDLGI